MIQELVTDEAILSQPCEKATADDAQVAQDLLDTLAERDDAAALAANQIGVTKCVIAFLDNNDEPQIMFNPVMKRALDPYRITEGCLSLQKDSKVTRFDRITVEYDELVDGQLRPRKQEFNSYAAQAIQHMIDHCKGKLI